MKASEKIQKQSILIIRSTDKLKNSTGPCHFYCTFTKVDILINDHANKYFFLPENLLSILESGQSKDKGLYIQCLHFLSVVCSEEGKLKTKRPADNSSVTMTTLLDLPLQSGILFSYFLKHIG